MTVTSEKNYDDNYEIDIYNYSYNKPLAMGITFITFIILLYIYFKDNRIVVATRTSNLANLAERRASEITSRASNASNCATLNSILRFRRT